MTDKWVSLTTACQSLNISESTIRRRIEQGKIESKREDGRRLVLIDSDSLLIDPDGLMTETALVKQLQSEIECLRQELDRRNKQVENMEEGRQRQDTIMLQLTRQLEQSQRMLEHHRESFWKRWFGRKRKDANYEPE